MNPTIIHCGVCPNVSDCPHPTCVEEPSFYHTQSCVVIGYEVHHHDLIITIEDAELVYEEIPIDVSTDSCDPRKILFIVGLLFTIGAVLGIIYNS